MRKGGGVRLVRGGPPLLPGPHRRLPRRNMHPQRHLRRLPDHHRRLVPRLLRRGWCVATVVALPTRQGGGLCFTSC